jgi:membrane-associated protease RseP (regulator of RpoE activity)
MSIQSLRNAANWALMVALVLGTGAMVRANDDPKDDGKVVRIGQSDNDKSSPKLPAPDDGSGQRDGAPRVEMPTYWIGLLGGSIPADDALRAHLDLPENQGLRVERVVPDSPAAKAGLKQHDILLRANENDLHEMHDLVDMVATEGAKKGQITLEILRHNKRETVQLTPEERPASAAVPQGAGGGFGSGFGGRYGGPDELMQQFGGFPMEFRNFGNGMVLGGSGGGFEGVPNGVSVNVQKQDGQPAQITVKRGDETWNLTDDPESLKQLPEDLRPFVEGMIHGNRGMQFRMPNFERGPGAGPGIGDGRLRERMERLEERLEEMQKRFGEQPTDTK